MANEQVQAPAAPAQDQSGQGQYDAIIQNILQEMSQLPVEMQTQFLQILNQEFAAAQQEQMAAPENQQAIADQMAALSA